MKQFTHQNTDWNFSDEQLDEMNRRYEALKREDENFNKHLAERIMQEIFN